MSTIVTYKDLFNTFLKTWSKFTLTDILTYYEPGDDLLVEFIRDFDNCRMIATDLETDRYHHPIEVAFDNLHTKYGRKCVGYRKLTNQQKIMSSYVSTVIFYTNILCTNHTSGMNTLNYSIRMLLTIFETDDVEEQSIKYDNYQIELRKSCEIESKKKREEEQIRLQEEKRIQLIKDEEDRILILKKEQDNKEKEILDVVDQSMFNERLEAMEDKFKLLTEIMQMNFDRLTNQLKK